MPTCRVGKLDRSCPSKDNISAGFAEQETTRETTTEHSLAAFDCKAVTHTHTHTHTHTRAGDPYNDSNMFFVAFIRKGLCMHECRNHGVPNRKMLSNNMTYANDVPHLVEPPTA